MTLVDVATGEVIPSDLGALAAEIHWHYDQGQAGYMQAVESFLAIGKRLFAARTVLRSDQQYGSWLRAQAFPFTRQWANRLCQAAEMEPEVRAVVETQVSTGGEPNIKKAIIEARTAAIAARPTLQLVQQPGASEYEPATSTEPTTFSAIVADPPWQYGNTSTRGAAEDHYPTMSIAELCDMSVEAMAADEAHLYLWTTNPFLREAFTVMEAWGFAYKTCLTWVKPQMGMGNYFRGSTEHVLFGVRGGMRTLDNALMNWFEAPRGKHSEKPNCFYDLVEKASPGPYLELFARRRRFGWHHWGNEA